MMTDNDINEFDELNEEIKKLENDIKNDKILLGYNVYKNSVTASAYIKDRLRTNEKHKAWLEQLVAIRLLYVSYKEQGGGFHYQVGRVFDGDYVLDNG